jgi:low affinity Fe/Cu permease
MSQIQNPYASPAAISPIEVDAEQQAEIAELQRYVNRLLSRGVIFSIIWVFGIGSFYSVYLASKAHRIIGESQGRIRGLTSVWWCYINGGIGVVLFTMVLVVMVYNSLQV